LEKAKAAAAKVGKDVPQEAQVKIIDLIKGHF
jgi:hypothetical protein